MEKEEQVVEINKGNADTEKKKTKKKKKVAEPIEADEVEAKKTGKKKKLKEEKKEENETNNIENKKTKKGEKKGGDEKPKEKKDRDDTSGGNDKKTLLDYIIAQNRPYSTINIFDNLHGNIKKKQLERILEALTEEKEIIMKEYATKVYLAAQHHYPDVDQEELKQIDDDTELAREALTQLKEEKDRLQAELKFIQSTLTNEDLASSIETVTNDYKKVSTNLKMWEGGEIQKIPNEVINLADKDYEKNKNFYKKIKKISFSIVDHFVEFMEMKREEVIASIRNFESDADAFSLLINKQI